MTTEQPNKPDDSKRAQNALAAKMEESRKQPGTGRTAGPKIGAKHATDPLYIGANGQYQSPMDRGGGIYAAVIVGLNADESVNLFLMDDRGLSASMMNVPTEDSLSPGVFILASRAAAVVPPPEE
jgi:hypothetical protein